MRFGVFSRLTVEDSVEYDNVNKALLQRFPISADGCRETSRGAKPERGEAVTQNAAKLSSLFGLGRPIREGETFLSHYGFCCSRKSSFGASWQKRRSSEENERTKGYLKCPTSQTAIGKVKNWSLSVEKAVADAVPNGYRPRPNGHQTTVDL